MKHFSSQKQELPTVKYFTLSQRFDCSTNRNRKHSSREALNLDAQIQFNVFTAYPSRKSKQANVKWAILALLLAGNGGRMMEV
jgi:hypothetical protein